MDHLTKIKDQLKQAKDLGMPIKQDLYTHLTEVFNRIMLHHPNDSYDRFETISRLVKENNFKICDPKDLDLTVTQDLKLMSNREAIEMISKWQCLLDEVNPAVKQDRNLMFRDRACTVPNFVADSEMMEWAGIGFGSDCHYLI